MNQIYNNENAYICCQLKGMRIPFFFIFLIILPFLLFGQKENEWKLIKQQKGIDVYSKTIKQSPIKAVKATKLVNCSLASAVAVILDVDSHTKWMYQSKNARILKMVNDTTWYYYAQSDTPWPAYDRDYVSIITITRNPDGSISVSGKGIPDYIPEKENIVRLPYSESLWKFTAVNENNTFVELYLSVDVGGTIPPWIINLFISKGPYQTLLNFSIIVHDKKYQNSRLPDFLLQ
jgi:hypothetical protein